MPVWRAWLRQRSAWWVLLAGGLLPMAVLVWRTFNDGLGANPAEFLIRSTGDWTLRSLCLVLAVTPLRVLLGWPELARFRRMLGLLTFAYAAVHMTCYAWFDMGLDWADMAQDVAKRPFILVGFSAMLLLLALAASSFNRAIRWLGAARWQQLHASVYAVAVLAILHFWWMRAGKRNFDEVLIYAGVLSVLLGWRVYKRYQKSVAAKRAPRR